MINKMKNKKKNITLSERLQYSIGAVVGVIVW